VTDQGEQGESSTIRWRKKERGKREKKGKKEVEENKLLSVDPRVKWRVSESRDKIVQQMKL
jgi:hypothetical protein